MRKNKSKTSNNKFSLVLVEQQVLASFLFYKIALKLKLLKKKNARALRTLLLFNL
jgi:hypothetical protein